MPQTIEAVIDTQGHVRLLENIKLGKKHKALVTILDEKESFSYDPSISGTIEIMDEELESGSLTVSEMFKRSLDESAEDLNP